MYSCIHIYIQSTKQKRAAQHSTVTPHLQKILVGKVGRVAKAKIFDANEKA